MHRHSLKQLARISPEARLASSASGALRVALVSVAASLKACRLPFAVVESVAEVLHCAPRRPTKVSLLVDDSPAALQQLAEVMADFGARVTDPAQMGKPFEDQPPLSAEHLLPSLYDGSSGKPHRKSNHSTGVRLDHPRVDVLIRTRLHTGKRLQDVYDIDNFRRNRPPSVRQHRCTNFMVDGVGIPVLDLDVLIADQSRAVYQALSSPDELRAWQELLQTLTAVQRTLVEWDLKPETGIAPLLGDAGPTL